LIDSDCNVLLFKFLAFLIPPCICSLNLVQSQMTKSEWGHAQARLCLA